MACMNDMVLWVLFIANACAIAGLLALAARALTHTDLSRYVPPIDPDHETDAVVPAQRSAPAGLPVRRPHAVPAD